MGNGVKGAGGPGGPGPIVSHDVEDVKKTDTSNKGPGTVKNEQIPEAPGVSGRSAQGLANDPGVALRKASLHKAAGLRHPTKAELEEIRNAIKDGKKEDAIKLTIKYYNIDTSGADEIRYAPPKKSDATGGAKKDTGYEEIGTATKKENGRVIIEIGDESFNFKGNASPEWLAAAISHESFHAKNHFGPDKIAIVKPGPETPATEKPKMSQDVIFEEIEAYSNERANAEKLGLSDDMLKEVNDRQNKLYGQLTDENRDIVRPMIIGKQPWPHQASRP